MISKSKIKNSEPALVPDDDPLEEQPMRVGNYGYPEPDESELEAFENLQLLPEHMARFLEIRRLRRLLHESGVQAVAFGPNGEPRRGIWTGRNGVRTLSYDGVEKVCAHMDELVRRRRETQKARRAEKRKRRAHDADVD